MFTIFVRGASTADVAWFEWESVESASVEHKTWPVIYWEQQRHLVEFTGLRSAYYYVISMFRCLYVSVCTLSAFFKKKQHIRLVTLK